MRFLALCISLITLIISAPAPGYAQEPAPPSASDVPPSAPPPEAVAPAEAAPSPPPEVTPAPAPAVSPALLPPVPETQLTPPVDDAELSLADLWVARMTETRRRRQRIEHWLSPVLLGGAALLGVGTALTTPGFANSGRILSAVAGGLALATMFPPMFSKPNNRGRWFILGGALFAMAYGASGFADSLSKRNKSCEGYCYDEKSVGWLGAAFFAQGILALPMALIERGPSLEELEAYEQLPPAQRPAAARKLLARIDRDERKALMVQLVVNAVGLGIMGTGAALVRDHGQRAILLGFAGFTLGADTLGSISQLLHRTRLERLVTGDPPDRVERVQW